MNIVKLLLLNKYKTISILTISMGFSMVLLMVRMKLTHSFFFLFLVWNLFLAAIPYAISSYLALLPNPPKFSLMAWFGVWLLFLPNAPYIITDLLHLKISETKFIWLDILVVISFTFCGILLFYLSILDMKRAFQKYVKRTILNFCTLLIIFLSSFGVYLGRFLRYNSWDILSNPKYLFIDIFHILTKPLLHKEAWFFTFLFGIFLKVGLEAFRILVGRVK